MINSNGDYYSLTVRVLHYLTSTFIVFWERDITSEHHGTPVHIHTIVYTLSLLSVLTFSSTFISCVDPLYIARPEEMTNPMYSLGAKLFVSVCRSTSTSSPVRQQFLRR